MNNRWGIELRGREEDWKEWSLQLEKPFGPFVENVRDESGDYLALRSSVFDGVETAAEIHNLAKPLFSTLNVVMSEHENTGPVTIGSVVEFMPNGRPRRHAFIAAEAITVRIRAGTAKLVARDAQGNVIEPPPAPSRVQLWMRAAALDPEIGSALRYLEGKPGWFELYKAYEAVKAMPNGNILKAKIQLFTRTANASNRHHPNIIRPPKKPMELWRRGPS